MPKWKWPKVVLPNLLKVAPIKTWMIFGSAVVFDLLCVAGALLLWLGGWDNKWDGKIIDYLGSVMVINAMGKILIVCFWTVMGISFRGPLGLGFTIGAQEDHDANEQVEVTTQTTTTVATPPAQPKPKEAPE